MQVLFMRGFIYYWIYIYCVILVVDGEVDGGIVIYY